MLLNIIADNRLMLSALRGAIEKCIPMSGSSRSIEVNERTKEMLDKVISEENADVFESFSVTVTLLLSHGFFSSRFVTINMQQQ